MGVSSMGISSISDGGSVGQMNGRGLSDGLHDGRGLVGPDDGLGGNNVLGNTLGQDRGNDIGTVVDNGRALVGDGSWDTVDMFSDLGNVGLFNDGHTGLHLDEGVSGVDLLLVRGHGNRCMHTGQGWSISVVPNTGSSDGSSEQSRQHHLKEEETVR